MKTKDLIQILNHLDPSGEIECSIDNKEYVNDMDIFSVHLMPAYYDGPLEILIRDKKRKGQYDVTGGKVVKSGEKIIIEPLSIRDAIEEDSNLPVEIENNDPQIKKEIDLWRKEAKRTNKIIGYRKELEKLKNQLKNYGNVSIRGDNLSQFIYAESIKGAVEISCSDNGIWVEFWRPENEECEKEKTFANYEAALNAAIEWIK